MKNQQLQDLQLIRKTAQGPMSKILGGGGAVAGQLGNAAALALLTLPVLAGAGVGYGVQKLRRPSDEKFENLSKEMMLAEINKQRAQTKQLQDIREDSEEDSVQSAKKPAKEIHIS